MTHTGYRTWVDSLSSYRLGWRWFIGQGCLAGGRQPHRQVPLLSSIPSLTRPPGAGGPIRGIDYSGLGSSGHIPTPGSWLGGFSRCWVSAAARRPRPGDGGHPCPTPGAGHRHGIHPGLWPPMPGGSAPVHRGAPAGSSTALAYPCVHRRWVTGVTTSKSCAPRRACHTHHTQPEQSPQESTRTDIPRKPH